MERFQRKNLNLKKTMSLMNNMVKYKSAEIRSARNENYKKQVNEWSKDKTFDFSKLGVVQKTNKPSRGRKVRHLTEQEVWDRELQAILEELDN